MIDYVPTDRQTESLYIYQTHHYHLTVVEFNHLVPSVEGKQTTLRKYVNIIWTKNIIYYCI